MKVGFRARARAAGTIIWDIYIMYYMYIFFIQHIFWIWLIWIILILSFIESWLLGQGRGCNGLRYCHWISLQDPPPKRIFTKPILEIFIQYLMIDFNEAFNNVILEICANLSCRTFATCKHSCENAWTLSVLFSGLFKLFTTMTRGYEPGEKKT